jgi:hypothetical protein
MGDSVGSGSPLHVEWEIMHRYPLRKKETKENVSLQIGIVVKECYLGSCGNLEVGLGVLKVSCSRVEGLGRIVLNVS